MTLKTLLRDLNSGRESKREAALKQARELPPEQLLELAEMESRTYRRRNNVVTPLGATLFVFGFGAFLYGRIFLHTTGGWLLIYLGLLLNWFLRLLFLPHRGRRSVAELIEQTNDPAMIGTALTLLALPGEDKAVKPAAIRVLTRLLPQMRADQAETLTYEQQQGLLAILKEPYENVSLTLAALKALEQIGDEKAIPAVDYLIRKNPPTPNMRRVSDAARECLPSLQQTLERSKQAQTLLRASEPSTSPDVLLRPAAHSDPTPSEQLLRPS